MHTWYTLAPLMYPDPGPMRTAFNLSYIILGLSLYVIKSILSPFPGHVFLPTLSISWWQHHWNNWFLEEEKKITTDIGVAAHWENLTSSKSWWWEMVGGDSAPLGYGQRTQMCQRTQMWREGRLLRQPLNRKILEWGHAALYSGCYRNFWVRLPHKSKHWWDSAAMVIYALGPSTLSSYATKLVQINDFLWSQGCNVFKYFTFFNY